MDTTGYKLFSSCIQLIHRIFLALDFFHVVIVMVLVYFLCVPHDVRNGGPVIELIQSGRNGSADPVNAAGADPGFQSSPIDCFGNRRCNLSSFQPRQNVLPFNPIVGLYLPQPHQNLHQFFSDRNTAIPVVLGISDLIGIRVSILVNIKYQELLSKLVNDISDSGEAA